jgi:hypothetical protein
LKADDEGSKATTKSGFLQFCGSIFGEVLEQALIAKHPANIKHLTLIATPQKFDGAILST